MTEAESRALAQEVYGGATPQLERYVDILASRGIEWGLLGPREGERLWSRHILNSAAVSHLVPTGSLVVDVGSGAGLPGLPLAILRPDLAITLLEPLQRRAAFLEQTVVELGLGERVRVVRGRAEQHQESYDVVTCRAVANLPKLLGWTAPLFDDPVAPGKLVALKGESAAQEVDDAADFLREHHLRARVHLITAHPAAEPTFAVEVVPA